MAAPRFWKCTNFGSCENADNNVSLEVTPGAEPRCPVCGLGLTPIGDGGAGRKRVAIIGGIVALAAVAAGATVMLRTSPSGGADQPTDTLAGDTLLPPPPPPPPPGGDKPHTDPVTPLPHVTGTESTKRAAPNVDSIRAAERAAAAVAAAEKHRQDSVAAEQRVASAAQRIRDSVEAAERKKQQETVTPVPVARTPAKLDAGTPIRVTFPNPVCESGSFKLEAGQRLAVTLASDVVGTGVRLAKGDTAVLTIARRRFAGDQVQLFFTADQLAVEGQARAVSTNETSTWVSKVGTSSVKRVLAGAGIGALTGGALGVAIQHGWKGAVIGAGLGSAAGAAVAQGTAQAWCIEAGQQVSLALKDPLVVTP
jgi:hypothetical protein